MGGKVYGTVNGTDAGIVTTTTESVQDSSDQHYGNGSAGTIAGYNQEYNPRNEPGE